VRTLLFLIASSFVPPVVAGEPLLFPVPSGAIEAEHVTLQPGIASQDHFFLNEKFPGSSALTHYARVFSKWRPCFWPEREWETIGDASTKPPRSLHRRVRFWVEPSNRMWVMVTVQYESPGLIERVAPVNDRQFVVVAIRNVPDALKDIALLDVKCDEAPNKSLERTRER
jgi:hypothetical protein